MITTDGLRFLSSCGDQERGTTQDKAKQVKKNKEEHELFGQRHTQNSKTKYMNTGGRPTVRLLKRLEENKITGQSKKNLKTKKQRRTDFLTVLNPREQS